MFIQNLTIKSNINKKHRFFVLELKSKNIAKKAKAGQFLHIEIEKNSKNLLLRRPFSIYQIKEDTVSILYETIGKGTEKLSKKLKGDKINSNGPLGKPFSEKVNQKNIIIVGGGIGIAPLLFLANTLQKNGYKNITVILGFRSKNDIIGIEDFKMLGLSPIINTNDGSVGIKGYVDKTLLEIIDKDSFVFSCGPIAMLYQIAKICNEKKAPGEVSIHNFMGCGFGVCLGCAFKTNSGYKLTCKDGPVLNSNDLII